MTKSTDSKRSDFCLAFSRNLQRFAGDSCGSIAILFALLSIPILIAITAAVDLSNAVRIKASLQAAADAGVLAAATALASGYDDSDKRRIAEETFFANLSPNLLSAFPAAPEVVVDYPNQRVQMDVQVNTDQLLTNFITGSVALGVRAAATADSGSPVCLLVLNPNAQAAFNIQGTADVQAKDCAVHVNSGHDEAMRQSGGGQATAENFCVHGDYSGTNYIPDPRRHCMREQDPLAEQFAIDLAEIDLTTCRSDNPKTVKLGEVVVMSPGVYCGGLSVQQGTVTLAPGVHVFRDGEFSVSALSWVIGEGVTILMTGDSTTRFVTQAGANLDITAPASGQFAGIAIAQDPTSTPTNNPEIIGGGYMRIEGIVYLPKQHLKITGAGVIGADTHQFAIVADTISVEGNGVLTIKIGSDYLNAGLPELSEANETVRLVH